MFLPRFEYKNGQPVKEQQMKSASIANGTAVACLVAGAIIILFGHNLINTAPSADGGIYGLFGVILIGFGYLIVFVTLIAWVPSLLVQAFGIQAVVAAIIIGCVGFYVYRLFVPTGTFDEKIEAGLIAGTVFAEPGKDHPVVAELPLDESIQVLGITEEIDDLYPWFRVAFGDAEKGYMWGRNLCARDTWTNGLYGRCESHRNEAVLENYGSHDQQPSDIDIIEAAYRYLPGSWRSKHGDSYVRLNEEREFLDHKDVQTGHWYLELTRYDETTYLYLHAKYKYNETTQVRNRWTIYRLNKMEMWAEKGTGLFTNHYSYKKIVTEELSTIAN